MPRKAVAVAAFLLGWGGACRPPPGTIAVDVLPIVSRPNGRLCEPARIVVRRQARWEALWAQISRDIARPLAPAVDFEKEMLLVVAAGVRGSGGHAIAVEGATLEGGKLVVSVVETSPGPSCITTQALTCPVAVARVAARTEAVEFRTRSAVHDCGP